MNQSFVIDLKDPYLKLCRLAGGFAFIQSLSVIFGIVGYFVWPHVFTDHTMKMIFDGIQSYPAAYFMKLDPIVLIGTLLQLPVWLGLWAALHQTDQAKSALALTLGIISTVAILTVRPIIEIYQLSSLYASANTIEQQNIYIAAGAALLAQFHGTSWAISIMSGGLSAIVFAMVMRKSSVFGTATIWTMLLSGIGALFVLAPIVGIIMLFFLGTIVGVIGTILCGFDLWKLSRAAPISAS